MTHARLFYTRNGHTTMETGDAARLAKKIETIRCDAEMFELRNGQPGDRIGGCERVTVADDRRIKWAWWYDRAACGLEVEGMHREVSAGAFTHPTNKYGEPVDAHA